MSVTPDDFSDDARPDAADPVTRAVDAASRDSLRLEGAIADFFVGDDNRLDDRARVMLGRVLDGIVSAVEQDIRRRAARVLAARGASGLAETVLVAGRAVLARLTGSGLLRDRELMDELIARIEQDLTAETLPAGSGGIDRPSLLVRWSYDADPVVADAAKALMKAENRRRTATDSSEGSQLPAELHYRLVWWIAAALREQLVDATPTIADIDRAVGEAALANLAAHDEGDRIEAAAERLAQVVDVDPGEWPALLVEAIDDRRFALFIALVGRAAGFDYLQARRIAIDPDGARLWLALRTIGLDRASIARIGLALSEADPRRDVESFADGLDAIVAVSPERARQALGPLRLHRDFQHALGALAAR